ncbi:hypothetical protein [Flectobacillus major]|uniref:hypothetical protein n=1 Tax=Flectobacillus major TaxID=103 RepID=UPI00047CE0EF|nr:hypothetical protein [Flectobacillus major]
MRLFFATLLQFSILPFVLLLGLLAGYWYFDPFRVLKTYSDFSNPVVIPNRDYVSTEVFIQHYPQYHYNSFILGSSRTMAFKPKHWQKYLGTNDTPYLFDASNESIYGIYHKLKLLDNRGVKIKNVLLIICRDRTFTHTSNQIGHLYIKHPLVSGESSLDFQAQFLKAYFSPEFLFKYYLYQLCGYSDWMQGVIENKQILYDTKDNTITIPAQEAAITRFPERYYAAKMHVFYKRNSETTDRVARIKPLQKAMLAEIKQLFLKHKTAYKVVISPLYDQVKLNPKDKAILEEIFGNNIYDFSGKNTFTQSYTNYYEASHYRPTVGDSILRYIYR